MTYLPQAATILITAAAAVGALVALWRATRAARHAVRSGWRRVMRAIDIIVGAPAIIDPDTGEPLKEAVPDIGTRMASVERQLNGGGLGTQMRVLTERVNQQGQLIQAQGQLIHRVQAQAAEIATTTSREIQAVSERLDALDEKVTGRLFTREDQVERLTAIAQELGIDAEPPDPRDL